MNDNLYCEVCGIADPQMVVISVSCVRAWTNICRKCCLACDTHCICDYALKAPEIIENKHIAQG